MLHLADTATWIGVGVAIGPAALALAASLVLLVLVLRRTGTADEAGPALEPTPEASADALETARSETARWERLSEIATTIDLDAVLKRTLAAGLDRRDRRGDGGRPANGRTCRSSPRWE